MRVETFQRAFNLSKKKDAVILNLLKRNRPFLQAKTFTQWCIHTFDESKRLSKAGRELLLNYPQIVVIGCDFRHRITTTNEQKEFLTHLLNQFKKQINK